MIKGIILKGDKLQLILTADDDIDRAILKSLDGAKCNVIVDNLKVAEKSISDGLLIEMKEGNS